MYYFRLVIKKLYFYVNETHACLLMGVLIFIVSHIVARMLLNISINLTILNSQLYRSTIKYRD